jgi:hypothetical protein
LIPENMTKFEEMIKIMNERDKLRECIYVEYRYSDNIYIYSSQNVDKLIYFTFNDRTQEWYTTSTGRH